MVRNFVTVFVFVLIIGALIVSPNPAGAYCVENHSATTVHAQALDATGFEADIDAGKSICCDDAQCLNKSKSGATILAVSGFVPVKGAGRPGWKSECRAKVSTAGTVTVTGTLEKLSCQVR